MSGLGFHLLQRARDSNPRYRKVQQFSRLPRSTTPPALCLSYNSWLSQKFISFNRLKKELSSIGLRLTLKLFEVVYFPWSSCFCISNPTIIMVDQTLIKVFRMSIIKWTIFHTLQDICLIYYDKETIVTVSLKFHSAYLRVSRRDPFGATTPPALCIKQNAKIAVLSTSTRQLRKKSNVPLTLGDFACL